MPKVEVGCITIWQPTAQPGQYLVRLRTDRGGITSSADAVDAIRQIPWLTNAETVGPHTWMFDVETTDGDSVELNGVTHHLSTEAGMTAVAAALNEVAGAARKT